MDKSKASKLQYLLINQLLKEGSVELVLPDGITIEIGITQEDKLGKSHKENDYCYVVTSRDGNSTILDSYNLGLQYEPKEHTIVCEDEVVNQDGKLIHSLDVV